MQRIFFGALTVIILVAAFAFLWITNPLYAFVGAVVFVVFIAVGFAFLLNLPKRDASPEAEKKLQPRRTGQVRRSEQVAKPEESWERIESTQNMPSVERNRAVNRIPTAPPQGQPAPRPILSPNDSQSFAPPPPPPPQPAPITTPASAPYEPEPIVSGGEPAELEDGIFMPELDKTSTEQAQQASAYGQGSGTATDARLDRKESKPIGGVSLEEKEANEAVIPDLIIDSETEDTGALSISDEDILEIEEQIAQERTDFDNLKENVKKKLELGTFGDSTEEIENFFQSAFEKAAEQEQEVDFFGDDDETGEIDILEGASELDLEVDTGANDESIYIDDEFGIVPELGEIIKEEVPIIEAPAENDLRGGSRDFDLMGMIGELPPDKQQEFFALMTEIPIGEQTETQLIELYEQLIGEDSDVEKAKLSEAQFTAYYPRQAAAKTEYGFYVYAHLPNALIESDIQQFQNELGGRVPKPKIAQESAKIQEGAMLAVMIDCDKLKFNQVGAMQQWQEPFVRFDFKFTADEALVDEIIDGRIAILLGMIEIASIDFQLSITPPNALALLTAIPHEPLTAQNFDSSAAASIYQKIFISYSHKDSIIAEHYRKVQTMAGNIIFMDTHSIRSGEDWELALKRFIDEADIFQLFWSQHSATSDHVKFEWEYALAQRCADTRCVQFIRPAYWEKPLVDIPAELNHLHFAFVEMNLR